MTKILLTSRALDDLQEIYTYSVDEWGEQVAMKYMKAFDEALVLLQNNEGLLKINSKISSRFRIYNVRKHSLICDRIDDAVLILTVKQVSMNLLERLGELEPLLEEEARILYGMLKKQQSGK